MFEGWRAERSARVPIVAGPSRRRKDTVENGPQDRRDYIWLVYSVFFFLEPLLRNERRYWLVCGAVYLAFLFVYVRCMAATTTRRSLEWTAGFIVMGLIAYPINAGASCFFVYTAAIVPLCVASTRTIVGVLAGEALLVLAEGLLFHLNWISIASTVVFLGVVGMANTFVGQQKRADCKLRMAQEEVERLAAMGERERIARDLHDVLGHTLSVIVLKTELAGRLLREGATQDVGRAAREIADVEATGRTALREVREAIGGYRAQGLTAELEQARRTLNAAGVALRCEGPASQGMTVTQETVLSLAVREAVTNIVRHAEARECRVSMTTEDGFHALRVEDDGTHRVEREGNGLRGMRERVLALGGAFSVESGSGTRVIIRLPVTAQ